MKQARFRVIVGKVWSEKSQITSGEIRHIPLPHLLELLCSLDWIRQSRDQSRKWSLWEVGDEAAIGAGQPNKLLFIFGSGPKAGNIPLGFILQPAERFLCGGYVLGQKPHRPVVSQNDIIPRGHNTPGISSCGFLLPKFFFLKINLAAKP